MFGVVLWSDVEDRRAVIWCADHGDLAYYCAGEGEPCPDVALDAGDLVQFDLSGESQLRRARNPRVVAEEQYPGIATRLRAAAPEEERGGQARDAIIVSLDTLRRRRAARQKLDRPLALTAG